MVPGRVTSSSVPLRRNPEPTHTTLDQRRRLGLAGMARACEELIANPRGGELDHAEWLGLVFDRELPDRQDRRLKARLRYAWLRQQASIEDVDCRTPRGLDRALLQKLALGGWIGTTRNLIIEGPTGVGTSRHAACSDIRRTATTTRCSVSVSTDCSPIWLWRVAMAVTSG